MTTTVTSMTKALVRSSPRKRGPSKRKRRLDSHLRGNERSKSAAGSLDSAAALYRLIAWMSPAYPIGAFSYSAGIEWAVEAGDIADAKTLREWLAVTIAEGAGFADTVLFSHAHEAIAANDDAALRGVAG